MTTPTPDQVSKILKEEGIDLQDEPTLLLSIDVEEHNAEEAKLHKLRKKIPKEVIEELEAMDTADLRARIVRCETNIHETERARERDAGLKEMKKKVSDAEKPYRDAKNAQNAIAQYAVVLLKRRGK